MPRNHKSKKSYGNKGFTLALLFHVVLLFLPWGPSASNAGTPEVNHIVITDVIPVSFSVVWTASEPSTCDPKVFGDYAGEIPAIGSVTQPMPVEKGDMTIIQKSEDNGVMKVRVTGLTSDNHYYFQSVTTSKDTSDTTYYPVSPPYPNVITESRCRRHIEVGMDLVPFSNDLLQVECLYSDEITPAEGTLLLAYTFGAGYPISSFVGDGVPVPYAYVDLNNAFSKDSFENVLLQGYESLMMVQYMGTRGMRFYDHGLPCNDLTAEFKAPIIKDDCVADFGGTGDVWTEDVNAFRGFFGLLHNFQFQHLPAWDDLDFDGDVDGFDLFEIGNELGRQDCPGCEQ